MHTVPAALILCSCVHFVWVQFTILVLHSVPVPYSNYSVRLADGPTEHEGRVEVFFNGEWGSICNDGWSLQDAEVICKQLHFNGVVSTPNVRFYGPGDRNTPVQLTQVSCNGDEEQLRDCTVSHDTSTCSHSEDVGIKCVGTYVCVYSKFSLIYHNMI